MMRSRAWGGAALVALGLLAPARDAAALWDGRLELFGAHAVTHDDNVFRISEKSDPAAVLGTPSKADTYRITSLGLNLDVPVSRQRFLANLAWNHTRYERFSVLDLSGHDHRALWQWRAGSALDGELGYHETRALASLANVQSGVQSATPNPLTTRRAFFNGGWLLAPRWRLQGAASRMTQDNEVAERQVNDIRVDGGELSVRYITPAKDEIGLSVQGERARFPQPLVVTGTGDVIDNAYRQRALAVVADWTPTGRSHLAARAGRVRRSYLQRPERDFEGTIYNVTYDWRATGKLTLSAIARREISTSEEVNVGFVLQTGGALRPKLRLSEKLELSASFEGYDREYLGDPGLALGTVAPRRDRVRAAEMAVAYRPARAFTLNAAWRRETRSSTDAFGDYAASAATVSARIGF